MVHVTVWSALSFLLRTTAWRRNAVWRLATSMRRLTRSMSGWVERDEAVRALERGYVRNTQIRRFFLLRQLDRGAEKAVADRDAR